jgi:ABC-type transporter Mla maintaining outer membrane lipid asymmetry ATPase subunit MlaF
MARLDLLRWNGNHPLSRERLNKIRTRIGIVFESSALISSWSVSENLALALRDLVFTITTQAVSVRHVIGYVPQAISVDGALIRVRKRNHLHSA